ncbi:hypothetical protein [Rubrobacter tropicus]|nr:hypothetical protein [Rubrobacter tropicus]
MAKFTNMAPASRDGREDRRRRRRRRHTHRRRRHRRNSHGPNHQ